MTKIDEKATKLMATQGDRETKGVLGGSGVSVLLRGKYGRYLQDRDSFNSDKVVDWDSVIRDYRVPVELSRDLIEGIGLEAKHVANVLVILPLIKYITDFKETVNRKKKGKFENYAQINSQIMKGFLLTLGDATKDFINKLEKSGWVEIIHSYRVGEKSKQYRIGPKFRNSNWVKVDWSENLEKFLPEILEKSNIARRKETLYDLWNRASCYFLDWQDMPDGDIRDMCEKTAKIGFKLRVNWGGGALEELVVEVAKKHVSEQLALGEACDPEEKVAKTYIEDLKRIDSGQFYVKLHDERYKYPTFRLFTPFVNLKKELREYITFEGRSLVNVDIRSCQVALLSNFYKSESVEEKQEMGNFQFKICDEDIYKFIADGKFERSAAKDAMFHVMFDKTINQKGEIFEKFKQEFPILNQRIAEAKVGRYKNVAYLMQKKESEIMIFGVLMDLLLKKNVTCLSIHDSISCFEEDIPLVKETITSFFFSTMGFCPEVRVD